MSLEKYRDMAQELELYDTMATLTTIRMLTPMELAELKQLISAYMDLKLRPDCVVVNPSRNQETHDKRHRILDIWGQLDHLGEGQVVLPEDAAALGALDQLLEEVLG